MQMTCDSYNMCQNEVWETVQTVHISKNNSADIQEEILACSYQG